MKLCWPMEKYVLFPSLRFTLISLSLMLTLTQLKMIVTWFNDDETVFVVKPTTLFSKIKVSIAKKHNVDAGSFRMLYDGHRCVEDANPKMMEMMAGRSFKLEVQREQEGGGLVRLRAATGSS